MQKTGLTLLPLLLCLGLVSGFTPTFQVDPAWAQDDDDDDDDNGGDDDSGGDDDEDDNGGNSGSGGGGASDDDSGSDDDDDQGGRRDFSIPRGSETDRDDDDASAPPVASGTGAVRPRQNVPARIEQPLFASGEIVTLALTEADLALLLARGYRVIEERVVPEIGIVSRRIAIPANTTLEAARAEVRGLASGTDADFNHFYRTEQSGVQTKCEGGHCASLAQIGWTGPDPLAGPCLADIPIGVIDTGINPDHDALAKARLDVHRLTPDDLDPSRRIHGTAVLSLLVGDPDSRSPGLLPEAQVIAVDAFHTTGGDERSDVFTLTAGMDFLANRGVRVINMSLAGPPNSVLERATAELLARQIVIVAAVGNGGPRANPVYPAAYPGVIGVTAIDRSGAIYRRAGQGDLVDLAAPGVEIWTAASVTGARTKTGTSFAAPFVTAAVASLLAAEPGLTADAVAASLAGSAVDLGEAGRDPVFGNGLIQAARSCRRR